MICVRPPLMYWPRREMKARNNMRKRVQRTQLQILRRIQNNKNIQSTANVQNDGHKNIWEKKFQRTLSKKISLKMEKEKKKQKKPKQKIVELFTVSLQILISGCAWQ